jgi:hypothetical protein
VTEKIPTVTELEPAPAPLLNPNSGGGSTLGFILMLMHDAKHNVKINPPTSYIWMILCSCGRLGVNRLGDTMAIYEA